MRKKSFISVVVDSNEIHKVVDNKNAYPLAHGFTLIELLVVVAIIAVLVAILLPSLQRAREKSKQLVCMSNLRSWALAISYYRSDYDGMMPPGRESYYGLYWYDRLAPYIGENVDSNGHMVSRKSNKGIKCCPTKGICSFQGENSWPDGDINWVRALTDYLINCDLCPWWNTRTTIYLPEQVCKNVDNLTRTSKTLVLVDGCGINYGGLIGEYCRTIADFPYTSVVYRHTDGLNILMADGHVEYQNKPDPAEGLDIAYTLLYGQLETSAGVELWQ